MQQIRLLVILLLFLSCSADFIPEDRDDPFPRPGERFRRFIKWRVRSRKPDPDAPEETGIGFGGHAMNVLKGGTLGFDFKLGKAVPEGRWRSFGGYRKGIEKEDEASDYSFLINPRVRDKPEH